MRTTSASSASAARPKGRCAGVPSVLTPTGEAEALLGFPASGRAAALGGDGSARSRAGALIARSPLDPTISPEQFHALAMRDDEEEGRLLARALAEVLDDLPVRRAAARRRALALRDSLSPARMVREYAELLRRAAGSSAL